MREGSLEAPTRHPIDWANPDFWDESKLDAELERVFDICHGCRRCFNLCDSFPKLFDMVDEAPSGELDTVDKSLYAQVVDACTLCDMCFMTKCPYVPPHEFNLDFPHLMLRAKAVQFKKGERSFADTQLAEIDRNAKLIGPLAGAANWATKMSNGLTRSALQAALDIDARATVPDFADIPLDKAAIALAPTVNAAAPAFGRKVAVYSTCYVQWNTPGVGMAALQVLAHNGVHATPHYPGCCGMPKFENGDLDRVAAQARLVSQAFAPLIDDGHDVIALTPSCALMLKFEWPLLLPDDPLVKKLARATYDITEYVVDIAKKEGLAPGLSALDGGIAMHFACHARAQNMGPKAAEMLRLIPQADVSVIERCSGHGGKWGMFKQNFETAIKVGTPAGRQMLKTEKKYVVSECPLAGPHLKQVMDAVDPTASAGRVHVPHPIELFARAYGFDPKASL
jgi:glycerol-3-phosphate dehydrogenase subunit C